MNKVLSLALIESLHKRIAYLIDKQNLSNAIIAQLNQLYILAILKIEKLVVRRSFRYISKFFLFCVKKDIKHFRIKNHLLLAMKL